MAEANLSAFLMMRSEEGEWTVTVCRELGRIVHIWNARQNPDKTAGALHIGFGWPPYQIFDEVADRHPGKILLTAAAKHALPKRFTTSTEPVACLDGVDTFIGLQGWELAPAIPASAVSTLQPAPVVSAVPATQQTPAASLTSPPMPGAATAASTQEAAPTAAPVPYTPREWIASFLTENPDLLDTLKARNIADDAGYLAHEAGLPGALRHRIGLFRLHRMVGTQCQDPCELARAAPPWLAERNLFAMNLSVRATHVFQELGINLVRDLGKQSSGALLNMPNFGAKSLSDILEALNHALEEGPGEDERDGDGENAARLLGEVRRTLSHFTDHQRDVLVRRLGFETAPETLQQVADTYDVSRERIRQIEATALRKLKQSAAWLGQFEQRILQMRDASTHPLSLESLEAGDVWFAGIVGQQNFFSNLVRALNIDSFYFVTIAEHIYVSRFNQNTWERAVDGARSLLSTGAGKNWSEQQTRSQIRILLQDTDGAFAELLWESVADLCSFSQGTDGARILTGYGKGSRPLVEAILAESDRPLHFSEIADIAARTRGVKLDPRQAHTAAARAGLLFDSGTFGLARHLTFSAAQLTRIRTVVESLIASGPAGRPWHSSEILPKIMDRLGPEFANMDKYTLNIALGDSSLLTPVGRMTWSWVDDSDGEGEGDATTGTGRGDPVPAPGDIHQAIVDIVRKAGQPLSAGEIKERLRAERGRDAPGSITPADPLFRTENGLWGLLDRDIPLDREEQKHLVDELVRMLESMQSGIHAGDLPDRLDLKACPMAQFLSIAAQDKRIAITGGQYIYLTNWQLSRTGRDADMQD